MRNKQILLFESRDVFLLCERQAVMQSWVWLNEDEIKNFLLITYYLCVDFVFNTVRERTSEKRPLLKEVINLSRQLHTLIIEFHSIAPHNL